MRRRLLCTVLALTAASTFALAQDADASAKQKTKPAVAAATKQTATQQTAAKIVPLPPARPVLVSAAKIGTTGALPPSGGSDIPSSERGTIISALAWAGDYTGAASNGDDPLTAAIKSFQKRNKAKVTGTLSPQDRALLLAAATRHEEEFGWRVIDDAATGARIGLPTKMLPNVSEHRNGTRWISKHGDMVVESFRIKDPDTTLASLFERHKKEPASRQIEYSVLRADSFYVSGLQGLKKFAVRAFVKDGELRGVVVMFDQAIETIVAPVTAAMASTFSAFPAPSMTLASVGAKRVEYTTGIIASTDGYLLASHRATEGCNVIVAASLGPAERVAEDRTTDLALLRVYGAHKLSPLILAGDAPQGTDVTVVGMPDPQTGDGVLVAANAKLVGGSTSATLQPAPVPGLSGAAVIDRNGRFAGMVETRGAVVASTALPIAPQASVIPPETIKAFLAKNDVVAASGAATTEAAKASVVRIICVRK